MIVDTRPASYARYLVLFSTQPRYPPATHPTGGSDESEQRAGCVAVAVVVVVVVVVVVAIIAMLDS